MQRYDARFFARQPSLNFSHDHFNRDRVVSAAGDDDVRVSLARFDELQVHWLNGRKVLIDYFVERSTTLSRVPLQAPNQPDIRVSVDEYFDVAQLAHSIVDEKQDAIDHNHIRR